jgi:hypothetical protein
MVQLKLNIYKSGNVHLTNYGKFCPELPSSVILNENRGTFEAWAVRQLTNDSDHYVRDLSGRMSDYTM